MYKLMCTTHWYALQLALRGDGIYTVYTLTFTGLKLRSFRETAAIRKNLDQSGNESVVVKQLHHKNAKTGRYSLG